jgi:hypothetical protein
MNSLSTKTIFTAALIGVGLSQAAVAQIAILDLRSPWIPVNTSGGVGTSWVKNNVFIPGSPTINAALTITGLGGGTLDLVTNGGATPLLLNGLDTNHPWLTFTLTFNDGTNPIAVPNVYFTPFDIDGESSTNLREFWGYKNTATPSTVPSTLANPTNIGLAGFPSGPGDMASYTTYAPKISSLGTNAPAGDGLNVGPVQAPWAVYNQYNAFFGGEYFYGFSGTSNIPFTRGVFVTGLQAPEPGTAAGSLLVGSAMIGMVSRRRRK